MQGNPVSEGSRPARDSSRAPVIGRRGLIALLALIVTGIVTMMRGIEGEDPIRAWEIYLVNLLFWTGISQAGVIFSAMMVMTGARWWSSFSRIAERMASFLPVSLVFFILFFLAGKDLFPWTRLPEGSGSAWLRWDALVARDLTGIALLSLVSFVFLKRAGRKRAVPSSGQDRDRVLVILSPITIVLYAIVYSLLAIDLVMTLAPPWYSTLFGGYFFIGSLYSGLAAIAILSVFFRESSDQQETLRDSHLYDIGKLLLAFCMITGDFFWSQFLVIWYGNIPEETVFLIERIGRPAWARLSWAVLLIAFILPFLILLSRRVKFSPRGMIAVSVIVLIGMWLERFILVVPSVYRGDIVPLGWTEAGITLGFFGIFLVAFLTKKISCQYPW